MNYLSQPNLLVQFWAAANQEFDKILDGFVRGDGWLFQDLGMIAMKANIGSIHQCVACSVTGEKGKDERLEHFLLANDVILNAAKAQWLAPWRKYVIDPSRGNFPPGLKRQVGGFFLLYMLYSSQPLPNRFRKKQRISMDSRDLLSMHVFNATMQLLPKTNDQFKELAKQLVEVFNELVTLGAFEFCVYSDEFITPSPSIRNHLSARLCRFTRSIYSLKDIRDQLFYITYNETPKTFHSLVEYGRFLWEKKDMEGKKEKAGEQKNNEDRGEGDKDVFRPFENSWSVQEIRSLEKENDVGKIANGVCSILKTLDFGPILTKERFTGVADKLLDKELSQCVRSYKRQTQLQEASKADRFEEKRKRHYREGVVKTVDATVWKHYLARNYEWVDDIFRNGGKSGQTTTESDDQARAAGANDATLFSGHPMTDEEGNVLLDHEVIDLDDDGEWDTDGDEVEDEESEVEEVVFKKPMSAPSGLKWRSSKKAKRGALSMPTLW